MEDVVGRPNGNTTSIGSVAPPRSLDEVISSMQDEAALLFNRLNDALSTTVSEYARQEPSVRATLDRIQTLADDLRDAFRARYQHKQGIYLKREIASSSDLPQMRAYSSIPTWTTAVEAMVRHLRTDQRPWFNSGWTNENNERWSESGDLLGSQLGLEYGALKTAFETFHQQGQQAAQRYLADQANDLRERAASIQAAMPSYLSTSPSARPDVGIVSQRASLITRLRVPVGQAALSPLTIQPSMRLSRRLYDYEYQLNHSSRTAGREGAATANTLTLNLRVQLPLFLDPGRDGGLVTDSPSTVNNVVLRLLALLPAGRLTATLFDPLRLGDSASVLYGLGDAAPAIIGNKVRTTERELADLLAELETHITFVTQKYLQGSFDSLTEYNRTAGEIAEPYRLLVLYDYPAGFRHSNGQLDDQALSQLGKIVAAGPRCGVYTLVATTQGQPQSNGPLGALPWLWEGEQVAPHWLATLIGGATKPWAHTARTHSGAPQEAPTSAATASDVSCFVWAENAGFQYQGEQEMARSEVKDILAHVQRGLARASDVRVTPQRVAELARARMAKGAALGIHEPETLPDPTDAATWWHGSSASSIAATFGRVGADDVAVLRFDTGTFANALLGGIPGSGKTVMIHSVIASLATRYSPEELELYLVDFKEGVEFKLYAAGQLPHARVVAIESDREFGISVLESLNAERVRRGQMFRSRDGREVDIAAYRQITGSTLPRIVLIIDEFQVLFAQDDKLASHAAELLESLIRLGRAFGIHTFLSSQTLSGIVVLGKHALKMIPTRIALQCAEDESRVLLAEDNPDARLLTHRGEGILNTSQGVPDANRRFQAAYIAPDERARVVAQLRHLADERSFTRRPVVFERHAPVAVSDVPLSVFQQPDATRLRLPVGLPLTLGGPVVAELRPEPGGNLLVLAPEDEATPDLCILLAALAAASVETWVCDFLGLDAPWSPVLERLQQLARAPLTIARHRDTTETLRRVAETVAQRHDRKEYRNVSQVLMLAGLHRARDLDPVEMTEASELLERILRDGSDVGVHVICWCDRPVSLQRRLSSSAVRELSLRLVGQMSKEDSFQIIDSDLAAQLDSSQLALDDHDRSTTVRVRRFDMPPLTWFEQMMQGGSEANHG